jgi:hypothetical protein
MLVLRIHLNLKTLVYDIFRSRAVDLADDVILTAAPLDDILSLAAVSLVSHLYICQYCVPKNSKEC